MWSSMKIPLNQYKLDIRITNLGIEQHIQHLILISLHVSQQVAIQSRVRKHVYNIYKPKMHITDITFQAL